MVNEASRHRHPLIVLKNAAAAKKKPWAGWGGGVSEIHCRANLVTFTQPLEKEEFIISWLASKSLLLIASSSKLAIYWKCHLFRPMQIYW